MNEDQRRLVLVIIVIVAFMLVLPPYHQVLDNGRVLNAGYSWIIQPPPISPGSSIRIATVNIPMLLTQWLGVLIIGGLAYLRADNQVDRVPKIQSKD